MTQKAIIYCRVSSHKQDMGVSFEVQADACMDYAISKNIDVVDVVTETYTASIRPLDRPEMGKVLDRLYDGEANTLIAYDSDRISRVSTHYGQLRDDFANKGVRLHLAKRGEIFMGDFASDVTEDIFMRFNEQWKRKLTEGMIEGRNKRVENYGMVMAIRKKFGYDFAYDTVEVDGKKKKIRKYVINEVEADIIRMIFDWYINDGLSIYAIFIKLNELYGQEKKWYKSNAGRILSCETYTGIWKYTSKKTGKVINVPVPQIIDVETFSKAQTIREENKRSRPSNIKYPNQMLRNIVKCAHCGTAMSLLMNHNKLVFLCKNNRPTSAHNRANNEVCPNKMTFRTDIIEPMVWPNVEYLLKNPDKMRDFIQTAIDADNEPKRLLSLIETTKKMIAKKETDFDDLVEKIISTKGRIAEILQQKANQLEGDINALHTELNALEKRLNEETITPNQLESFVQLAYDLREGLDQLTGDEKNAILKKLKVEVRVHGKIGNKYTKVFDIDVVSLFGEMGNSPNCKNNGDYSPLILDLTKLPINQMEHA